MTRIALAPLMLLSALVLAPAAHAQVPLQLPSAMPQGETAFAVADTDSQRFFAVNEAKGPSLTAGEAVTVIARAEGRVRFMVRGQYGWVPKAALSKEPPAAPEPEAPSTTDPLLPPG